MLTQKLIPVAKIHTAFLILTNFDIKKLLSFLNIEVAKERPWLKKSLFLCEKTTVVANSTRSLTWNFCCCFYC